MPAGPTAKGQARRSMIASAAGAVLGEQGLDAVTHRAVAGRAGIPLASMTYYFGSADILAVAAATDLLDRNLERSRARLERVRPAPRAARATARLVLDVLHPDSDGPALLGFYELFVASARRPDLAEVLQSAKAQMGDLVAAVLDRCAVDPARAPVDRLVAVVDGAVLAALVTGSGDPRRDAVSALAGLLKDSGLHKDSRAAS